MSVEQLSRKKRVRAGHRASATKIIGKIEDVLAVDPPNVERLSQLKLTLTEKLGVLKLLDAEVLDMMEEELLVEEIEQSDEFREGIHTAMVRLERGLAPPLPWTPPLEPVSLTHHPQPQVV